MMTSMLLRGYFRRTKKAAPTPRQKKAAVKAAAGNTLFDSLNQITSSSNHAIPTDTRALAGASVC
ncbi:hypothetical protein [Motiliproteus sp.]|uniref:hypothetical protein n=1 Tax=Motiliproteus sp. TaxID=1898955 RepID=UPI003BA97405